MKVKPFSLAQSIIWKLRSEGYSYRKISKYLSEHYNMPRQKLPETYWQTGQIEVIRYSTIIDKKSITGSKIFPVIMNPRFVIDIDNSEQWEIAEYMLKIFQKAKEIYLPTK